MQKNNCKTRWNVKTLVFMALIVAMHLVLTRVFVVELGAYRISLGSICTILAGLWMGPAAGAVCGMASDLLGCFMKGYALNPIITLAAIMWGVIPAVLKPLWEDKPKKVKTIGVVLAVIVTAFVSSLVLTTTGLVLIQGYNFYAIIPGRVVQFVILVPIYCVITCFLYFSPLTVMVVENVSPRVLKNKIV